MAFSTVVLRKIASFRLVELKTSLRMMMLSEVASDNVSCNRTRSSCSFASQIVNVAHLPQMGEQPIEEEEPGARSGDRAAERGEIMQLAERSGERRLPSPGWVRRR